MHMPVLATWTTEKENIWRRRGLYRLVSRLYLHFNVLPFPEYPRAQLIYQGFQEAKNHLK